MEPLVEQGRERLDAVIHRWRAAGVSDEAIGEWRERAEALFRRGDRSRLFAGPEHGGGALRGLRRATRRAVEPGRTTEERAASLIAQYEEHAPIANARPAVAGPPALP